MGRTRPSISDPGGVYLLQRVYSSVRSLESAGHACSQHQEAAAAATHNMHIFDRSPSAYRSDLLLLFSNGGILQRGTPRAPPWTHRCACPYKDFYRSFKWAPQRCLSMCSVTHQQRCHKSRDGTLSIYLSIHLLSPTTCPNGPTKGDTTFCWRWQKESILPRARGGGGGERCQLGLAAVRGPWERPLRCERREVVHVCEEPRKVSRPTLGADMRRTLRSKRPRDVLYWKSREHHLCKYSGFVEFSH